MNVVQFFKKGNNNVAEIKTKKSTFLVSFEYDTVLKDNSTSYFVLITNITLCVCDDLELDLFLGVDKFVLVSFSNAIIKGLLSCD